MENIPENPKSQSLFLFCNSQSQWKKRSVFPYAPKKKKSQKAIMTRKDPASQPIGNIGRIALRCNPLTQIPGCINRARIVDSRSFIEPRDSSRVREINTLSQAITIVCSRAPLANHLGDDAGWARVLNLACDSTAAGIVVAGTVAIVALHQAWVAHAEVGRAHAHAAAGFLHDDGENETVVDFRF